MYGTPSRLSTTFRRPWWTRLLILSLSSSSPSPSVILPLRSRTMTSPVGRSSICIYTRLTFNLRGKIANYKWKGQTRRLAFLHFHSGSERGASERLPAGACKLPLLEAFLAENRSALRGTEGHGRVLAARGAGGLGLDAIAHRRSSAHPVRSFRLARLAALWLVLELLVSEEELFTRRPDELRRAVHTPQGLVLELHRSPPLFVDRGPAALLRFAPELLAITLARQCLLGPALVPRFQVEGVLLDVLDDVFLLHLPLEPPESALNGFALLNLDFSHAVKHPLTGLVAPCDGPYTRAEHATLSQAGADSRRNTSPRQRNSRAISACVPSPYSSMISEGKYLSCG